MEKLTGLNTELGTLKGRDAIFLEKILFNNEREVTLIGEFNSQIGDRNFEMTFKGIVYFSAIELDFDKRGQVESLGTIENSERLKVFRSMDHSRKTHDEHRHYYVRTYDTVFEIISAKFELTIKA
jgi:hypothetical protein